MPDSNTELLNELVAASTEFAESFKARQQKLEDRLDEFELVEARKVAFGDGRRSRRVFNDEHVLAAIEEAKAGRPSRVKAVDFEDGVPVDYRIGDVSGALRDRLRVASLLPTIATQAPTVAIYRATAAADQAAVTAQGSLKPESSPGWEEVVVPIVTIAHLTRIDNAILNDIATARSLVTDEMLAGLLDAESEELLNGSGPGHVAGLLASAAGTPVTLTAGEPYAEAVHRAVTTLRCEVYAEPDGIVLHPADLETLRFARADSGDGVYLAGDPLAADAGSLWGVPLVVTTRIPRGKALVGAFALAARLFVRQTPVIELNPWAEDPYQRNQVLIRAEERIGLGIVRPQALCVVSFSTN